MRKADDPRSGSVGRRGKVRPVRSALKTALAAVGLLAVAPPDGAVAQEPEPPGDITVPLGEVVERLGTIADPDESYALYLPPSYDPERSRPVLFVMDPRGRAPAALEIFREGAESSGWIVVSAYGTRSDETEDPNARVLNALFADVRARFNVDPERLYLAGFSGTARAAWYFASQLRGNVAGVIGVGAALPPGMTAFELAPPTDGGPDAPFAFFGGTGILDFNYEEVRELESQLALTQIPYWIETWDGPHSWPPVEVGTAAVEWLELQWARHAGHAESSEWATAVARRATGRAARFEREGDYLEAWRLVRDVVRTLGNLADVEEAQRLTGRLAGEPGLQRQRERADRLALERRDTETRMWELLVRFRGDREALEPDRVRDALELDRLRTRAEDEDPRVAASARRTIASLAGQFSFYQPREWASSGDFERARAALEIAALIEPESPRVCYQRALVEARAGVVDAAVEALECALSAAPGFADAARAEPLLDPIRDDPRVRALLSPPR